MKFKTDKIENQYKQVPLLLRLIVEEIEWISQKFGIEITITRVSDKVKGESGVHSDLRAVDIRDKFRGKHTYTLDQRLAIVHYINAKFRRIDKFKVVLHHAFGDGPEHFHVQIPFASKDIL